MKVVKVHISDWLFEPVEVQLFQDASYPNRLGVRVGLGSILHQIHFGAHGLAHCPKHLDVLLPTVKRMQLVSRIASLFGGHCLVDRFLHCLVVRRAQIAGQLMSYRPQKSV